MNSFKRGFSFFMRLVYREIVNGSYLMVKLPDESIIIPNRSSEREPH